MPETMAAQRRPGSYRQVVAATIGNTLEWFDLAAFGFFASAISQTFFPGGSVASGLMLTFGTFAVSYLVRPIGAVVIGAYADRVGRKRALTLSIQLMVIGTLAIAVMPGYAQIGVLAPVLVLLARLLQGFSAGGEFGSATAFLVEHSPGRRGFMASWQFASQGLATVLSAIFGTVLGATLTTEQLNTWGWRIPFFFGLLLAPVGLYIRKKVSETPEFEARQAERTEKPTPVRDLVTRHKSAVAIAIGALIVSTALNHVILYMPTYAVQQLGLPTVTSFVAVLITGIVLTVVTPLSGHLSDRFGRTGIMIISAVLLFVTIYPLFALLNNFAAIGVLAVLMAWIGLLKACYFGPLPALMSELFPVGGRVTGLSVSYNLGVSIFGGLTPLAVTWLISATGSNAAPAWYLMVLTVPSLIAVIAFRRRSARDSAESAAAQQTPA